MLTIRKEQIDELLKNKGEDFVERMEEHLKVNFSKELAKNSLQVKDLKLIILNSIENANEYNIEYENDMILYIECVALLGPGFDTNNKYPQVIEILNRKNLTGNEKMDQINEFLTFELE
jgi:hypothetical protein